ncbi:alpha/beta hydrolase fold domain-containing protein [Actinomadura sp. ATCC 31491]|uniref:Alpha/beta hydrolase fold domain-containing protein n=1 Tax=Actinomadura luzonensis TaxID=2805427 RepID=A0ABT0G4K7_9ACTN|nr:alpha/beta hydrolase [Actinomadura luzonensis]MCK2219533.1 alpha/beta hydrolase fold domain-containing protein [Actinomadura luzonensis]
MALHPNLDPELRAAVEAAPLPVTDLSALTLEELQGLRAQTKAFVAAFPPPPQTGVTVEDRLIPGPEGAPEVRVRIYRPAGGEEGGRPGLYWIHGGGMIMGVPEMDDALILDYVERLGLVAVSVDYRLAPEHPHPAPVEDCYAGLVWTAKSAAELGIDPARLAVGGASAGGGLAAATVLLARDRGGPDVLFQLLLCPMLDDRDDTPSTEQHADAVVWTRQANRYGWRALLGDQVGGPDVSPYAAPARAADLSGLPPAFVDVGEMEVFRDEDMDYALRLARAGVSTEFHLYPGAFHGFDMMVPDAALSRRAREARVAALKRAYGV